MRKSILVFAGLIQIVGASVSAIVLAAPSYRDSPANPRPEPIIEGCRWSPNDENKCPGEKAIAKSEADKPESSSHRASGRDARKRSWCKWGQQPKPDGCDNLGSGVGG